MCISQNENNKLTIYVNGQQVEQMNQVRYLCSLIPEDRYCIKISGEELRWQKVLVEKKKLFTGRMNLVLKKRIMKCLIWSVALYVAETWTLTQTEMWIWRRMEKISFLDKVTNEEVLRRLNEDRHYIELYLAKETSMDWPCLQTRWTFA